MLKVAVYGKGGIGKSTITSNLAAAFAAMGKKVIQIGCDPKADSTINLLGGEPLRPVMNFMREEDEEPERLEDISKEGFGGVLCIETGGPTPGLGCAGRGIITALEKLKETGAYETYKPDIVLYDVLGDVVCEFFHADAKRLCRQSLYHHFRRKYGDSCRSKHRHGGAEFQKSRLCISWRHYSEPAECQTGRRKSAGTGR